MMLNHTIDRFLLLCNYSTIKILEAQMLEGTKKVRDSSWYRENIFIFIFSDERRNNSISGTLIISNKNANKFIKTYHLFSCSSYRLDYFTFIDLSIKFQLVLLFKRILISLHALGYDLIVMEGTA